MMLDFLREENIDPDILEGICQFRQKYSPLLKEDGEPIRYLYYGKEIWEAAAQALLCGKNLLLAGPKATGKNMLAENLAWVFGRPSYNLSFHINMDASYMIGTDTFREGQVMFRPGPIYESSAQGGFCILDEINMARNEALAVLHSVLDFRRIVNVPGYPPLKVHEAARFIATMNYGYAGTRDLNEALTSRFVILHMPEISRDDLEKLLKKEFPSMKRSYVEQFSALFQDIEQKCRSGELTSRVLDLRGLLDSLCLISRGLSPLSALDMGITNKTFDEYEQTLIRDVIASRISPKLQAHSLFER